MGGVCDYGAAQLLSGRFASALSNFRLFCVGVYDVLRVKRQIESVRWYGDTLARRS